MDEIGLIVNVLRQTFDGRAWHGPSFMNVLDGVDKAQASERPLEKRHSIWEIVNHCSYWTEAVTKALHGEKLPDIKSNEDWPQMRDPDEDWPQAIEKLKNVHQELINSIKDLNESQFTQEVHGSFHGQSYTTTYRKMLHGISDHNTYHGGQIAILRKKTV